MPKIAVAESHLLTNRLLCQCRSIAFELLKWESIAKVQMKKGGVPSFWHYMAKLFCSFIAPWAAICHVPDGGTIKCDVWSVPDQIPWAAKCASSISAMQWVVMRGIKFNLHYSSSKPLNWLDGWLRKGKQDNNKEISIAMKSLLCIHYPFPVMISIDNDQENGGYWTKFTYSMQVYYYEQQSAMKHFVCLMIAWHAAEWVTHRIEILKSQVHIPFSLFSPARNHRLASRSYTASGRKKDTQHGRGSKERWLDKEHGVQHDVYYYKKMILESSHSFFAKAVCCKPTIIYAL